MAIREQQQRASDQLVRLVQVFFALVLAQGLFLFRTTLLDPFDYDNRIAVMALASVFYTTIASWVDWHVAMAHRPYDTRQNYERYRVYADVAVAIVYAYLLFTIEPLVGSPDGDLTFHLLGYPLVFVTYVASGLLRRASHGKRASKLGPLVGGLLVYSLLVLAYLMRIPLQERAGLSTPVVNGVFIVLALICMFSYRAYRRHLAREDSRAAGRLKIGIDVDGVLADQISGVLPRIKKEFGVTLKYEDITDWRLPIKSTDIAQEIVRAQGDRDYVVNMRVHEGAKRLLKAIRSVHRIIVMTARKGPAGAEWTAEWLRQNGLPHDEVVQGLEVRKSEHRADVLIDDYIGNVVEYLSNTDGVAVLVDQPWNRERETLASLINDGRLFVVKDLFELRMQLPDIVERARKTTAVRAA